MAAPRRARLLGVVIFVVLALGVVDGVLLGVYRSYRSRLESELGLRLIAVASGSAAAVNGHQWKSVVGGDPLALAAVREELDEVRRMNGVTTIFLFDMERITRLDLGDQYPLGRENPALLVDLEAVTTALAGWPAATRLYTHQGGYLKSAYAPVTDAAGEVVGGVGVEASATYFEVLGQVKRTLLAAAAFVSGGLLLLGALFARLLVAREALESRLRRTETLATLGEMTAMLAHEIRNPLGIIRGAAERVGARHGLAEDEVFRFIPEEVDRLERTLGSYLEFARPRPLAQAEDLGAVVRRTLDFLGGELERKGIQVAADIEEGSHPVQGDPHLLRQAMLNLVLNSRDAMETGGTLSVRVARRGNRVTLAVEDTGTGMSETVRRRAADPFFTSKPQGSGLGLAVVQRVVDDLGGRLEIRSRPGQGTVVTLALPLAGPGDGPGPPDGGAAPDEERGR